MKRTSRAVADCSTEPLRILFVENAIGNTEFMLQHCDRACTIKRLYSLAQVAPFLRTSIFQILLVNDSPDNRADWSELHKLQDEFPAIEIVVLTDAEQLRE